MAEKTLVEEQSNLILYKISFLYGIHAMWNFECIILIGDGECRAYFVLRKLPIASPNVESYSIVVNKLLYDVHCLGEVFMVMNRTHLQNRYMC